MFKRIPQLSLLRPSVLHLIKQIINVAGNVAPPDAPVLASYSNESITATRVMCRYPLYSHYIAGSPNWASAYLCS